MSDDQVAAEEAENLRSARTSTRTKARTPRIEVITGPERRRKWSIEEKREIVVESLKPEIGPSGVVRKYGISSGQLYTWRRQLTQRIGGGAPEPATNFARVNVISAERPEETDQRPDAREPSAERRNGVPMITASRAKGLMEVVLPDGTAVRVDAQVDVRALRRVLAALCGR